MIERARRTLAAVAAWAALALAGMGANAQERGTAAPPPSADSPGYPPMVEGKPVDVKIGCYVLDFTRVTARDESFDVTLYLEMSWRDPRALAAPGTPQPKGWRRLEPGKLWAPRVFFHNALEQPKYHDQPVFEADPEGNVWSWAIVSGKFSAPLDLRRFPFDTQVLPVRIASYDDESIVRLVADPELVLVTPGAFVSDWHVRRPSAAVGSFRYVPRHEAYSLFTYEVTIERRSTFYFWRVLVPLSLIVAVSWAAFWFEPTNLQPLISTCASMLLSLVAFGFSMDFAMPKVAYLNLTDMHALIGFWYVGSSILVVLVVHVLVVRGQAARAVRVQKICRWLFPTSYVAVVLLNVLVAFVETPDRPASRLDLYSGEASAGPVKVPDREK